MKHLAVMSQLTPLCLIKTQSQTFLLSSPKVHLRTFSGYLNEDRIKSTHKLSLISNYIGVIMRAMSRYHLIDPVGSVANQWLVFDRKAQLDEFAAFWSFSPTNSKSCFLAK